MSKPARDPRRLSQLCPQEDPQGIAILFQSAKSAPQTELPRVRWRLRASLRFRANRPRRLLRMALVAGGLLLTGGVLGAVVRPYWEHRKQIPAPRSEPAVTIKSPLAPRRTMRTPVAVEIPALAPAPVETHSLDEVVARKARPRPVRLAQQSLSPPPIPNPPPEAPVPPSPRSAIAVEQALLADIVKALRTQHAPMAALVLLDEHGQRFPETALAPEVAMLRVEALLGLDRKAEALSALDGLPLASMPNRYQRLALRGELRLVAGRWHEAWADFDKLLSAPTFGTDSKSRDLIERALWGRASARSRLGDQVGARADLASYLRDFPSGRFATQAAALLRGSP